MEIFSNFKALTLVIFFFGASIFVHELGHFLVARWRGLKVTRFSIGFGPKLFGWTRDGVEYIVAALPIGGYVALPQLGHMEAIEGEADKPDTSEITWTSKILVLVAGAFFNVIFALLLGTVLYFLGGRPASVYNDITTLGPIRETLRISEDETVTNPAFTAGLKQGDQIKAIDGKPVKKWETIEKRIIFGAQRTEDGKPKTTFTILRDGQRIDIVLYPVIAGMEKLRTVGIAPEFPELPPLIGSVFEGLPAAEAGLLPGDLIVSMDHIPVKTTDQVTEYVKAKLDSEILFEVLRNKETLTKTVVPKLAVMRDNSDKTPAIGIAFSYPNKFIRENPVVQIRSVFSETLETLEKIINPNSNLKLSNMSGPVGMGRIIYQAAKWDIRMVLWVVIIININLAILNLLPIPVLDGGHIAFATIEKIRGKAIPQNLLVSIQGSFVILLLSLMIYVTVFDGRRFVSDLKQNNNTEEFVPKLAE